ncbi:4-hydroxy-3-methylbut-2-enyl diphosphate reductase [Clostridiales bacterium CHKCI001]|nr:4-hydroxy-3-methylbut-2-enyl diphosphate reductase [Clostridiales bacterium CHKCI001]
MEVVVAKSAGFCFGVKRAVDRVYEEVEKHSDQPIYTFGPIIHNEEVVCDLEEKGVQVIDSEEELKGLEKGIVVIRSHGVSRNIYELLNRPGIQVIDVTCPFVKKIHRIVDEQSKAGYRIVIIGNAKHPEVQGIIGWSNSEAFAVETDEDLDRLPFFEKEKVCIVSQTTFNYKKFQYFVEKISKKGYDINVLNTICNATHERQVEAKQIAGQVDGMIVIGGKHSSNTQKLFEICKKECYNTCYIQTVEDLDLSWGESLKKVGITAGASTPNKIIEEVQTKCQS